MALFAHFYIFINMTYTYMSLYTIQPLILYLYTFIPSDLEKKREPSRQNHHKSHRRIPQRGRRRRSRAPFLLR